MEGERPDARDGGGTAVVAVALLSVLAMLLLAPAVGRIRPAALDVWPELLRPAYQVVQPEPTEQARYLIAVMAPIVIATLLLLGSARRGRIARAIPLGTAGALASLLALGAIGVSWVARSEPATFGLAPDYFSDLALLIACCIAAALASVALSESGRAHVARVLCESAVGGRSWSALPKAALVIGLTALYVVPAVYTTAGLGDAVPLTNLHVPFTFADFAAFGNGATPLADFASQYSNGLPWVLHPVLSAFDYSPGTFTVLMSLLTVVCMLALWRTLALTVANAWIGTALYLPVLALSLRPTIATGDQRASNASVYQIMPERYLLPLVLAWLCARHLRGRRPRSPIGLFFVAGLALLNNPEFGAPALFATFVALVIGGRETSPRALLRLGVQMGVGAALATAVVSAITSARSGSLPDPALLTYFSRLFAAQGFGMQPMPVLGLYLALYVTFAGALILAATRRSAGDLDRVLCGMLGFAGAFGLGASGYYVGRSNAITLVALFPAWGLCLALLAWTSFSWMLGLQDRRRLLTPVGVLALCPLVGFGLAMTDVSGVPDPRVHAQRLLAPDDASTTEAWNMTASRFIELRTEPGESVLVLRANGHLDARRAGVRNVGAIGHPLHVISGSQLDAELERLRAAGGSTIFTHNPYFMTPSLTEALLSNGWERTSHDRNAGITEWTPTAG